MTTTPSAPSTAESADALSEFIKEAVYKTLKKQLLHFILTDKSRTLVESVCKISYPKLVLDTLDKIIVELRGELENEHSDTGRSVGQGSGNQDDNRGHPGRDGEPGHQQDVD